MPSRRLHVGEQPLDVKSEALGPETVEASHPTVQQRQRAATVPTASMVQSNADLKHTLVQQAYGTTFFQPCQFEHLVRLEVTSDVEQLDPFFEKWRWLLLGQSPHTSAAVSTISCSLATCSSYVRLLPSTVDENPH